MGKIKKMEKLFIAIAIDRPYVLLTGLVFSVILVLYMLNNTLVNEYYEVTGTVFPDCESDSYYIKLEEDLPSDFSLQEGLEVLWFFDDNQRRYKGYGHYLPSNKTYVIQINIKDFQDGGGVTESKMGIKIPGTKISLFDRILGEYINEK